ncbi:helix-turn-helix domain-containing protein [Spongiibacter sp. UBA1325]|uniref:helix-turn-helix domain-containing protein n=1 Tax=Spongiibacter sp. UBA1325 TaxID=1947543 RepID=UPI00257A04BB|nr:helix-turn-helix transcriptional regulator [Spongiibacter sp. UBA1325]
MEMTEKMELRKEYLKNSRIFSDQNGLRLLVDREEVVIKSNIRHVDFEGFVKGHANCTSVSSVIEKIASKNTKFKDSLINARKKSLNTYFRGETGLKRLRLQAGLSQAELAEACQTTQPYIARYESGGAEPGLSRAVKMAAVLKCSIEELNEAFELTRKSQQG